MSWHPQPRRILLDGTDAVALTTDDYDRLDAIRRQAGAQASRIHALREQLAAATALLGAIRQAAVQTACGHHTEEHAALCFRETVLALLESSAGASSSRPGRTDSSGGAGLEPPA